MHFSTYHQDMCGVSRTYAVPSADGSAEPEETEPPPVAMRTASHERHGREQESVTELRGPKAGPLRAVFGRKGPFRVPRRTAEVTDLGVRTHAPVDPARAEHTRFHQAFLGRVINYLSADAGVRQFVDWGCPVPGTAEHVRKAHPENTVVHIAPLGTAGMLSPSDTAVLSGGCSGALPLLHRLTTSGLVDLDEPVAVLRTRPFPAEEPFTEAQELHSLLRGGGYLALTSPAPRSVVTAAFAPFQLLDPGVADLRWWPYPDDAVSLTGTGTLAGVGHTSGR